MSKRSGLLIGLILFIALFAAAAQAQGSPFVNITSPANNAIIDPTLPLNVTVNFGNAPEGGSSLLVRAWDDSETTMYGQASTLDLSLIPQMLTIDSFAPMPTAGSHGHLTAYMLDSGGTIIATSAPIPVTYGNAPPPPSPTNTPTNTPPAPTATNTPSGSTQVSITSPAGGSTVNPVSGVAVGGTGVSLTNTTVMVRLFNANNDEMGEQSTVPNGDNSWDLTVTKTQNVPITGTGSLIAYAISGGTTVAISNPVYVNFTGGPPPPTPTVQITFPLNGSIVDRTQPVTVSGTSSNLPGGATIQVQGYLNSGNLIAQGTATPNGSGNWTTTLNFLTAVNPGAVGYIIAYGMSGSTTVATSNTVNVTWGTGTNVSVGISQPAANTVVNITHLVHVSGTSHNLPTNQVTVRASRSDGTVIIEATANVNGSGNWSTDIPVNVTPGTPGIVYVFARDSGGSLVAQNSVNVTWGSSSASALVVITYPQQGAIVGVNGSAIQVNGFGNNVPGNTVGVRALDTFGNVLSQQSAVLDQQGNWTTYLNVNVAPGTPGSLYAYVTNSPSGSIIASSRVNVTFGGQCFIRTDWPIYVVQAGDTLLRIAQKVGSTVTALAYANCIPNANLVYTGQQLRVPQLPVTPQPQNVTLRIISPIDGAQVDTLQRVVVTGAGMNIVGDNVVVRALDSSGNLLAQQVATIGPMGSNGESPWQVSLSILLSNSTPGTLYAFVQTPSTANILADALVSVNFIGTAAETAPPGEQRLIINTPTDNSPVSASGSIQVTGQVMGPIDGNVMVRLLDNQSNVLAEVEATLEEADAQGNANWQAVFTAVNVPAGTRGMVYAYVPTPFDLPDGLADSVNVSFGQPGSGAFVTIADPLPYATLDTSSPIAISGTGGSLFQGNVVVRALDAQGNVLTETSTALNPSTGTWQTTLTVNVAQGTRGSIVAFSTTGQNGSIAAFASIYVTFGDATSSANFVKINAPLQGSLIDPAQTLMIAGTADGRNGNSVKVQIVDDQGNVLVEQPRNLNPSLNGNYSVWQMLVELRGMAPGTHLRIIALTTSRFDGTTLATDSVDITVGPGSQTQ